VSEFGKRALTGAAYVALTLGAAWVGQRTTLLLFLPVCAIGAREWHRLHASGDEGASSEMVSMMLASVTYLVFGIVPIWEAWTAYHAAAVIFSLLVVLAYFIMRNKATDPAHAFTGLLGAVLYVALPFALITHLLIGGPHIFIGFMFLLWTSDTGAYLVGRSIGRTKLMPAVSPGKTWEGLLGGVALTMLVSWLLSRYWLELTPLQWMVSAAVVAITATLGDLLESAFKRARGVKDSGDVLPGHGGILDRFDGFLLAAPAMFVVVHLLA
jgi:phosphatidate cytidylyltransferase